MSLRSKLLKGDSKLEACLVQDAAHVTPGAMGNHVSKIQIALALLDDAEIASIEISSMRYGTTTANAVLAYKRKRKLINFSYQTQADNIVGKMTIATLDSELSARRNQAIPAYGCGDPIEGG